MRIYFAFSQNLVSKERLQKFLRDRHDKTIYEPVGIGYSSIGVTRCVMILNSDFNCMVELVVNIFYSMFSGGAQCSVMCKIFTARTEGWGKVMFLHLSVCPQGVPPGSGPVGVPPPPRNELQGTPWNGTG